MHECFANHYCIFGSRAVSFSCFFFLFFVYMSKLKSTFECKKLHLNFRCASGCLSVAHDVGRCHCILMLFFLKPIRLNPLDTLFIQNTAEKYNINSEMLFT